MVSSLLTSRRFVFLIALAILFIDILTKAYVHQQIPLMSDSSSTYPYGGIPVFQNVYGIEFSISHATNRGAAWGLFASYSSFLLAFRIALVVGLCAYVVVSERNPRGRFPLAIILVGAVGNIVDSFAYGHVVDMFHFIFWGYDYPVFNVADASIFIGIALLILLSWFQPTLKPAQPSHPRQKHGSL